MKFSYHGHSLGRKVQWKVRSLFSSTYDSDNESEDEPKDEYAQFAADLAADLRRRKVTLPSKAQNKKSGKPKQMKSRIGEWSRRSYVLKPSILSSALSNETTVTDSTLVDDSYSESACHELYCPLPGIEYSPTWKFVAELEQNPSTSETHNKVKRQAQSTSSQHSDYMPLFQYRAPAIGPEDSPEVPLMLSYNRNLSSSSNRSLGHPSEQYNTNSNKLSIINEAVPSRMWSFTSGLPDVVNLHPLAIRSASNSRGVEDKKDECKFCADLRLQNSDFQSYRRANHSREAEISVRDKGSGGIQRFKGFHRNGKVGNVRHGYVGSTIRPCEELEQLNTWNSGLGHSDGSYPLEELQRHCLGAETSVGSTIRPCDELEQLNTWNPGPKQTRILSPFAELQGANLCAATVKAKDAPTLLFSTTSPSAEQNSGDLYPQFTPKHPQRYAPNLSPPGMPPLKFVPSAGVPYHIHRTALKPRLAPLTVPLVDAYKKLSESKASVNTYMISIARNDDRPAVKKPPYPDADLSRGPLSNIAPNVVQTASGDGSERRSNSSKSRDSSGKCTEGSGGSTSGSNHGNKRKKTNSQDGDQEELSDRDSHQRKKKNDMPNPHGNPQTRRLKCPYYQRRPEECRLASCIGPGFTEMAKLKDHLKRVHLQPLRCLRCWEEVQTRDQHLREDDICSKREEPYDRRISPLKLEEIRFNRAPFTKDQSVEEKWAILYRIIFPDAEMVPSPYEENDIGTRMEKLLVMSLEQEITKELGDILGNIIDIIRQRLPGIVARCRNKARRLSEDSLGDLSTSPPTPTTSLNSGTESIFDKPVGLGPSSTTLDTDAELPVLNRDVWAEQNDAYDFLNCNESMDRVAGSSNEPLAPREWENWESIFQFPNS